MISVCMAIYNGERFLAEQLASILVQLGQNDEVIVVDDCSTDGSSNLVSQYDDGRIRLLKNQNNLGPAYSFERALSEARGRYIFLSDQDDVWSPLKVQFMRDVFISTKALVIVSDARIVDSMKNLVLDSLFEFRRSKSGFWNNLYKNGFVGCCMALDSEALAFLLPFPKFVGMHDEWIGLCSSLAGRVKFIPEKLIDYRRHEQNVTQMGHGSIQSMIRKRLRFLFLVCQRLPRVIKWRWSSYTHGRRSVGG